MRACTLPLWLFVAASGLVVYVMAVHTLSAGRELTAMSGAAQSPSSPIARLDAGTAAGALRRELVGWAWLAVGALAVAGVFALLLALSRVPGMDRASLWPIGFFYKGLVIHVVFSLVIWLMGVFAFLVTVATQRIGGDGPRAAPLGRIGQGVVLIAFPCLFAPAFFDATQPELTNYVPLIRHPAYDLGLLLLAAGVLAPVIRLLVNLPGRARPLPPLDPRHVDRRLRLSAWRSSPSPSPGPCSPARAISCPRASFSSGAAAI